MMEPKESVSEYHSFLRNEDYSEKWTMCSEKEARNRSRCKELSMLECTSETFHLPPRNRVPHPQRCVKKYRRSAAGGGVFSDLINRSLSELQYTVNYLLGVILPTQRSCQEMEKQDLIKIVDFVEDRLRAVQVDVTKLNISSTNTHSSDLLRLLSMEARIVRSTILIPYLLSDLSSQKYQRKFANAALCTAFSQFFSVADLLEVFDDDTHALIDEIQSYAALCHLVFVLSTNETAMPLPTNVYYASNTCNQGNGISAMEGSFLRYCHHFAGLCKKYDVVFPRWRWALEVAASAQNGNFVRFFNLFTKYQNLNFSEQNTAKGFANFERQRWEILTRCTLAQVIPLIRIGMMRQYNKCFGKLEKVSVENVSTYLNYSFKRQICLDSLQFLQFQNFVQKLALLTQRNDK